MNFNVWNLKGRSWGSLKPKDLVRKKLSLRS